MNSFLVVLLQIFFIKRGEGVWDTYNWLPILCFMWPVQILPSYDMLVQMLLYYIIICITFRWDKRNLFLIIMRGKKREEKNPPRINVFKSLNNMDKIYEYILGFEKFKSVRRDVGIWFGCSGVVGVIIFFCKVNYHTKPQKRLFSLQALTANLFTRGSERRETLKEVKILPRVKFSGNCSPSERTNYSLLKPMKRCLRCVKFHGIQWEE